VLLFAALLTGSAAGLAGYVTGRAAARLDALRSNAGSAIYIDSGSSPTVSDRRKKENFRSEDPEQVLQRLARLPIESWNYRAQSSAVRHVGPTAQDFYSSFQLGESDTTITATDMAGVGLLAIQALERRTARLEAQLRATQPMTAEGPARVDSRRP
jgi:hypothetical protein